MNYIDRNNYAAAKLQGLVEDLHLHGDQYQVGLSILFVGYILMQVPSNLLLNYVGRPSWYLGGFTIAWGLVSACTSQVSNYAGIVACRFILGIVEAPFFAGVLFYLSKVCWGNSPTTRILLFAKLYVVVYKGGTREANGDILQWFACLRGLWKSHRSRHFEWSGWKERAGCLAMVH